MRGKKAKKIRKLAFGDRSQPTVDRRGYARRPTGQIINTGARADYQLLKKLA